MASFFELVAAVMDAALVNVKEFRWFVAAVALFATCVDYDVAFVIFWLIIEILLLRKVIMFYVSVYIS